jgi:hypothetical protein
MKRRAPSLFETTSQSVFQELSTWERLAQRLEDLRLRGRELIQVVVLGSEMDVPAFFRSDRAPLGLTHLESTSALSVFEYRRKYGRNQNHVASGRFAVARTGRDRIYLFLFVAEPSFWRHGIAPLAESLYPRAACPFLTQNELHQLLKGVQRAASPQRVRILEFSSKKRLGIGSRKRFQSVREWTDMELESAFEEARGRNDWFRSVSFDIVAERDKRLVSTGVRARLSKYSHFTCNGRFGLFENALVRQMVEIGAERLRFFSNRDRLSSPHHAPVPLRIEYPLDVFKSSDQAKRLIAAMQKFKHGTCTILHANPYVHLTIVDNRDFSSADLWVLSQDQILLVPEIRASAVALKRIVNHIFENFREGKISEFKETQA